MDWETIKYNFSEHPIRVINGFFWGIAGIVGGIIAIIYGAGGFCLIPFSAGFYILFTYFSYLIDYSGIWHFIIMPILSIAITIGIYIETVAIQAIIVGGIITTLLICVCVAEYISRRNDKKK